MNKIEEARRDLAAAHRLAVRFDLHEGIDNHFSVALSENKFLVNRWGVHWSRLRASDILLVDVEGNVLDGKGEVERSAFFIHRAVHQAKPSAVAVLHTHQPHATALTCVEGGLIERLHQNSLRFYKRVAYDPAYGGGAFDTAEGHRIATAMGDKDVLMMGNHGVMIAGKTVGLALHDLYFLERAAKVQLLAQSSGQPLILVSEEMAELTAQQIREIEPESAEFFSLMRAILDQEEPDYRE